MPDVSHLLTELQAADDARRIAAAEELARLGLASQPAAVALVRACGDESDEVREWAVAALEGLGPPADADAHALAGFLTHPVADVGFWAATLLSRLETDRTQLVEPLLHALEQSPNLAVREVAARALGTIGPPAAAAVPALQGAASSAPPRLARLAREALAKIQP